MEPSHPPSQVARYASIIGFSAGAGIVLYLVLDRYLVPAFGVAKDADPIARKQLAAISALVLAVILTTLLGILILALRPGRFLFPRGADKRTRTTYPDAWEESGRRLPTPPPEDEEQPRH